MYSYLAKPRLGQGLIRFFCILNILFILSEKWDFLYYPDMAFLPALVLCHGSAFS